MNNKGVIYYNRGESCIIRLLVSIKSLRNHYDGPITVFLENSDLSKFSSFISKYNFSIINVDSEKLDSSYVRKIAISRLSPYEKTVFIDADTLVVGRIDEVFDSIEGHDLVVTQFCDWSSSGGAIGRRIKGFSQYISEETLKNALSYGPAVNTGVYGFHKDCPMFDEWLQLAKMGQSSKLYIPDEIACQILLHKYKVKILGCKYNVSAKFGINDEDKRVVHFHGRKHCRRFPLAEVWIKAFIELLQSKEVDISKYIDHDNNLRKFLKFKYGWDNYVYKCLDLLGIEADIQKEPTYIKQGVPDSGDDAPNNTNTTIVTACDPKYVECLKISYPNWIKYKNINQFPIIVYINGFEDNDSRLDFLRIHKNIKLIHWDMHNVDNHREKMLSAFVFGPPKDVKTKYWLKLDSDAYTINSKDILSDDMKNYDIVGHKWGYTKPFNWINILNTWSIDKNLNFTFTFNQKQVSKSRYYHHRTNSFVQLHKTEFTKEAAKIAGDRLPIPSHDTFLWYVSCVLNKSVKRYNFKKYCGMYNKKTAEQLVEGINSIEQQNNVIKININASRRHSNGWLNTNKKNLDITQEKSWIQNNIQKKSLNRILAEHVINNLEENEIEPVLQNFKQFIASNGILRVAVPDGYHPDKNYIEKINKKNKILYNYKDLIKLFSRYGFVANILEYFDENGDFHFKEWSKEDGYVKRSSRYDKRNKKDKLSYTSLIIDFKLVDQTDEEA